MFFNILLLIVVFITGVIMGSKWQPKIMHKQTGLFVEWTEKQGVRHSKKLF